MVNMSTRNNRFTTGSPGVEIVERVGLSNFTQPFRGTACMLGVFKRGPVGVPIPILSLEGYNNIFGDPGDSFWHFYENSYTTPDCVEGFFRTGEAGILWLIRVSNGKKGRAAEITLKSRMGHDCLRIKAANIGRWGGAELHYDRSPVLMLTSRTFTIYADPENPIQSNEYEEGVVQFDSISGVIPITGNTETDEKGLTIFSVSPQYNLLSMGVKPNPILGNASYDLHSDIGVVNYETITPISGDNWAVSGNTFSATSSTFISDLNVGDTLIVNDDIAITVLEITSDFEFLSNYSFPDGYEIDRIGLPNLMVIGVDTEFTSDFNVGDSIYVRVDGEYVSRKISAILGDTQLRLESGFGYTITNSSAYKENVTITINDPFLPVGSVQEGAKIINPNNFGQQMEVVGVIEDTESTLSFEIKKGVLDKGFAEENIYAIAEYAQPFYSPRGIESEGLSVEVAQGKRYPETHFSLVFYFRGKEVLRVDDASLDPSDPLFVEPLINDSNIAYRTGTSNYHTWVTVESLFDGIYTTTSGSDARPANSSGIIRKVEPSKIYTDSDLCDYKNMEGGLLYPNPYSYPRGFSRVQSAKAPQKINGYLSNSENRIVGIASNFVDNVYPGDYIFISEINETRKVISVESATSLTIDTPFSTNIANMEAIILGFIQTNPGFNLLQYIAPNQNTFVVTHSSRLVGGYDGDTGAISDNHYIEYASLETNILENAVFGRNMGSIRIAIPDINSSVVQKAFVSYCERKAYEFRLAIPLNFNSPSLAESYIIHDIGRSNNISVAWPSYGFINNPVGAGEKIINLCGEIMGGESARAVLNEGWMRPFAGLSARLPRIIKLPYQVDLQSQELINMAGIQPIRTIGGSIVVFGARCPASESVFEMIHVGRTQREYIRIFLEAVSLMDKIFLPKDPLIVEHLIMALNAFARREYEKGAFDTQVDFTQAAQVQNGSENTGFGAVSLEQGRVEISFSWRPPEIIELISLTCSPMGLTVGSGNRSLYEFAPAN